MNSPVSMRMTLFFCLLPRLWLLQRKRTVLMSFALWAFDVLALWHCIKIAGQHPRNERQYSCPLGNASLLSAISQG